MIKQALAAELALLTSVYIEYKPDCLNIAWASKAWHQSSKKNMYVPFVYKGLKVLL